MSFTDTPPVTHRPEYDEQSLQVIADMLSTVYSNPLRSMMREYLTNGIDAHREAGVTRPVHLVLPNETHPKIQFRDFGNGMDAATLKRVFFSYGRSTKRDSDEANGMFGIGAKAAYAVSPSWEVTSVHNGMRYDAAAYVDDGGVGFSIADGAPTDEPSGVTVTVPLPDVTASVAVIASAHASSLGMWFPKRAVETRRWGTDGNATYPLTGTNEQFTPYHTPQRCGNVYLRSDGRLLSGHHGAVLGDVLYPYPRDNYTDSLTMSVLRKRAAERSPDAVSIDLGKVEKVVVELVCGMPIHVDPAGDGVHIPPSRESVKDTNLTLSTLTAAVNDTVNEIMDEVIATAALPAADRIRWFHGLASKATGSHSTAQRILGSTLNEHSLNTTVFLDFLDIPNMLTPVSYRDGHPLRLRSLIDWRGRRKLLITDVPHGKRIPNIRAVSREHTILVSESSGVLTFPDGSEMNMSELVDRAVTLEEYCAEFAPKTAPRAETPLTVWDTDTRRAKEMLLSELAHFAAQRCVTEPYTIVLVADNDNDTCLPTGYSQFVERVIALKTTLSSAIVVNRGRRKAGTIDAALQTVNVRRCLQPDAARQFLDARTAAQESTMRSVIDADMLIDYACAVALCDNGTTRTTRQEFFERIADTDALRAHWVTELVTRAQRVSPSAAEQIKMMCVTPDTATAFQEVTNLNLSELLPLIPSYTRIDDDLTCDHIRRYLTGCFDLNPLPAMRSRLDAWLENGN